MNNNYLTEGNILKALLKFVIPILGALFLQATYSAVDLIIVGKFATTADISGVATGSMLLQMITAVLTALAMGTTVMIGEATGANDIKKCHSIIGTSISMFAIIAVILTLFLSIGSGILAGIMNAPAEAITETRSYILICGMGIIFIIAYNILGAIFRGTGNSSLPLIAVAIACIINIVLDLVFVCLLNMGASGAAMATVLSQSCSVIVSIILIRKTGKILPFSIQDLRIDKIILKKMLKIGIPVSLQEFCIYLSFAIIQSVANSIGIDESAGVGVGEKVSQFLMIGGSAYLQGMSVFVAQNTAANKISRVNKGLLVGISTAFLIGILMAYISFFHGNALAHIFDNDLSIIIQAQTYLKAYAIDCLLTPFLFCFIGYFNGKERTFFVMVQGIAATFAVRIPVIMFMSTLDNPNLFLIGLANPISSFFQILLCLFMYVKLNNSASKHRLES